MPRIVIDENKCKSCGICMEFCPNKLIKYSETANVQGFKAAKFEDKDNKCTGCAICAVTCPEIAIKEVLR